MRGFYADPSRLNTRKGERGWLQRQEQALARMAGSTLDGEPESWRAIDADRQAMIAEREREALADADRRRAANARLRVTCPCCGSGAVPVERAELVLAALDRAPVNDDLRLQAIRDKDFRPCPICDHGDVDSELAARLVEALSRIPANRDVDYGRLGNLYAVAQGETYPGADAIRAKNGAKHPRRAASVADVVMPAAEAGEAQSEEEAVAELTVEKPVKRFVPPPHLCDE